MVETLPRTLAAAIVRDFPDNGSDDWWIGSQCPAARVIDCVLSLRKNYKTVVEPRVKRFLAGYPTTISCQALADLIKSFPTTQEFTKRALRLNAPAFGDRLLKVTHYLVRSQAQFQQPTELERLRAWAASVSPGDYRTVGARGFALAGFQYLRMLFGADTAKPDVHIIRYVAKVVGEDMSASDALVLLEEAGKISGRSVRRLDNVIWQRGAAASKNGSWRPCCR